MFKHRLTKFGISSFIAMFMLFIGGSLQSCKDWLDVYPYDDPGDPEWLGSSVYDFLKKGTANHTYANFVEIIDSLGEEETLASDFLPRSVLISELFPTFERPESAICGRGSRGKRLLSPTVIAISELLTFIFIVIS